MASAVPFSSRSGRTGDSPISRFMRQALDDPGLISLAAGFVDGPSLPAAGVAEAAAGLLADPAAAKAALQYGNAAGLPSLRDRVLRRACAADGVSPGGLSLSVEDVAVTSGSQQLLYMIAEALLDPGDIVITEAPSYFVFHDVLKSMGAAVMAVPMDGGGLDVDALADLLGRLRRDGSLGRVKMIYTVDYFQNPTGLTLAESRRAGLVELARRFSDSRRIMVLEDAAYRELRFEGGDINSLKSHDPDNEYVITTYTFSKPFAPGLKTGYGFMPRELCQQVLRFKGAHDFGSNNLSQHLLDRVLDSGAYDAQVARLREVYRHKRDVLLSALDAEFAGAPGVSWTRPAGGLYVWLSLPDDMGAGEGGLADAAMSEGVLYVPGEFGHVGRTPVPKNHARLCYGVVSEADIPEAVRRLRRAYDVMAVAAV